MLKNSEHDSLFVLNKKLFIRAGIHKMLVRIANREDPDQTASSEEDKVLFWGGVQNVSSGFTVQYVSQFRKCSSFCPSGL